MTNQQNNSEQAVNDEQPKREGSTHNFKVTELQTKLKNYYGTKPYDWLEFVQSVINWNKAKLNGEHDYSDDAYELQQKLTHDEYLEVLEAIDSGDKTEIIKELVDVVVTASYGMFLTGVTLFKPNPFCNNTLTTMESFSENYQDGFSLGFSVFYQWAISELEKIGSYGEIADGILLANWTKIPTVEDFVQGIVATSWTLDRFDSDPFSCPLEVAIQEQILAIESGGRYNNVTGQVVSVNAQDRVVFKDGNGKLLKPCTFKEFKI